MSLMGTKTGYRYSIRKHMLGHVVRGRAGACVVCLVCSTSTELCQISSGLGDATRTISTPNSEMVRALSARRQPSWIRKHIERMTGRFSLKLVCELVDARIK